MKRPILLLICLILSQIAYSQKFGELAQTPPMGWNNWNYFATRIDEQAVIGIANDTIYTNREGVLVAMELATGKQLWAGKEKVGGIISSPAIADGKLVTGTSDGHVCAFSARDGSLLWSAQTGETLSSTQPYERGGKEVNSSPAIFGKSVYVGAGDGKIHVFSLADGKDLGSYCIGVPVLSSPFISDSALYIGAYDGNLYSFTLNARDR